MYTLCNNTNVNKEPSIATAPLKKRGWNESESERAYQIDIAANNGAMAARSKPQRPITSQLSAGGRGGGSRWTVVYHTHRGWRCHRTPSRHNQHIAHGDILPLQTVGGLVDTLQCACRFRLQRRNFRRQQQTCKCNRYEYQPFDEHLSLSICLQRYNGLSK